MIVLAGLLAGLAMAVLLARPATPRRLFEVVPGPAAELRSGPAPQPRAVQVSCGLAGLGAALVLGIPVGLFFGFAVALAGPSLLQRLQPSAEERDDRRVAPDLPLALDLLGACLAGGAPLDTAVRAVAAAVPGPCGQRLFRVAGALAVGSTPREAWAVLGAGSGPAGAAGRALARAADGGAPVAAAMVLVAGEARSEAAAQATRAARRAGVLAVVPLGVCFLPAFVLIGVVPTIVGLAGPLLNGL